MNAAELTRPYAFFAPAPTSEVPFRHFIAARCIDEEVETSILDWLEREAPWRLARTDFYEQWEFDLRDADLPQGVARLLAADALAELLETMGAIFRVRMSDDVRVVAHRLERGQRIGIHNDLREGGETHRLTVQLNRGLSDEDGGFFVLFNSDDARDVHRVLRPISGSAVGFAIGPSSYHAVSKVHGGTRYTLVYSFRAADRL